MKTGLLETLEPRIAELDDDPLTHLGWNWPVLQCLLLQLSQNSYPRDRYIERIDATAHLALISLHALYDGKKGGVLVANPAGDIFEKFSARQQNVSQTLLREQDPFFRMLADVSFLLSDRGLQDLLGTARIIVRDFLDARYLRLSIAGLMPGLPDWLEPMTYEWKKRREIVTPKPIPGHFGIIDDEDLDAWRKLQRPLADIGYHIIGQLGMGQFGRVYEALNIGNSTIPQRVAVKVDRIRKGYKKEAIEAAGTIMDIARGLAPSPHVIRVFDAGTLRKFRSTYHVLQFVEGDTLDNLLGITGTEHASILRPNSPRSSPDVVKAEFLKSISRSAGEKWRRARKSHPFLHAPTLAQTLDILTSKALWLEEVHGLGLAVNDLKNGNIMLNRRGQFKGIDLDSYSPVFSPIDKIPDFFFLAMSALQMITRNCEWNVVPDPSALKELLAEPERLERRLSAIWPYGSLENESHGRLTKGDIVHFIVGFVEDARTGRFAREPGRFSQAIDALVFKKRCLSTEEMVLE